MNARDYGPLCRLIVWVGVGPFMLGSAAASAGEALTLDEAVAIATRNSFVVVAARAEAERARQAVLQAKGAVLPQLRFDATYTRFDKEISVVFGSSSVVVRPIDQSSLSLNLTQPIDVSGLYNLAISGAGALKRAADARVTAAINDAALNAKTAFFQVLEAVELVGVAQERVSNAKASLDVALKRVAAGVAPRFDVIRFEADLSTAEQELLQAANRLEVAKASFNLALSRDTGTPVELVRVTGLPAVESGLDALLVRAKASRPEAIAARLLVDFQVGYRRARERERLPTLNVSANYAHDPKPGGFGTSRDSASATAILSFPVFEGGTIRAKVEQARQEESKARATLDQILLSIELEVRQAYLNVKSAEKVISTTEKTVALAGEALRLANVRYEAGVGTTLEVSDATVGIVRARTAHINAVYAYWAAVAALQRAVGSEDV